MTNIFTKHLSGGATLLVGLAILVLLNVLASGFRWRADWTEDRVYSLSPGALDLLKSLDRDVTLKLYFTSSLEGLPAPLKQYAQRVAELLREFTLYSQGHVVLETYDPKPDSDEEEWAQRYGVEGQSLGMLGGGPELYLGLVAVSGGKESVLPVLSPAQEPELEYLVMRLISEVTRLRKPRIGLLSSVPVTGVNSMFPGGPRGMEPWLFAGELQRLYEVVPVEISDDKLPDDLDLLLVIQPANLPDGILFAMDQYLLRGGHMLAYVDPAFLSDPDLSSEYGRPPRDLRGFIRLINAWGLELDTEQAAADRTYATRVRTSQGTAARNVAWLSLLEEAISQDELATRSLRSLLLPVAGAIKGQPAEGLQRTTLLQTSPQAGTVPIAVAEFSEDGGAANLTPVSEALPLAIRLQGRFKTAFPAGSPVTPPPTGEQAAENPATNALKEAVADGVVVLVGDADILADRFAARALNFFGRNVYEPLNDNLSFTLNLVEQLSGRPELIGLRRRGSFSRPFTRVIALEREAQDRWRREETELQSKLMATQSRLEELQTSKDPNQTYIISPEQQREIEQFRKELFQTRRALKDVRKNLRQDIEQLGFRLKVINLGLMPALVGLFGMARGLNRRRKAL